VKTVFSAVFAILTLVAAAAAIVARPQPAAPAQGSLPLNTIKLPAGFRIAVYAGGVDNARSMTLSPDGVLFVGTRTQR
jgi:glucose/arabinose dehydrogenase